MKRDPSRGPDYERRQIQALRDLSQQYLQTRARDQLAYAALHLDQSETIHMHMLISSNGRDSQRRVRLAKHDFLDLQKQLETSLQQRYPDLEEQTVYNKPWEQSLDFSDREQAMKKRTRQPSKKDNLRTLLQQVFDHARTPEEAQRTLAEYGVELTPRGRNISVTQDTLTCRLKTLGLEEAYSQIGRPQQSPERDRSEGRQRERAPDDVWERG